MCVVDVCVQSWGVPAILSGRFMCFFVLVFNTCKVIKNYFWWELWACSFCELDSQDCSPVGGGKCGKRRPSGAQRVGHVFEVCVGVGGWDKGLRTWRRVNARSADFFLKCLFFMPFSGP
jgi:hypothetical protein